MCDLGLGMDVVYLDDWVDESDLADLRARRVSSVTALFEASDVVSIHVPRTPATEGIVDAVALSHARPGAIVVNTARGGIIVEAALADALRHGRIAGAGIDVFDVEPPTNSPLLEAPDLVSTPHTAGLTDGARRRMATEAAEEVRRVLSGEEPRWRA